VVNIIPNEEAIINIRPSKEGDRKNIRPNKCW